MKSLHEAPFEQQKFFSANFNLSKLRPGPNLTILTQATSTTPDISPEDARIEKRRIYRNVLIISFSFLLLFVAFESMSKLQSSINVVGGLGVWSNAMVYASLILSCMFLPSIMIDKLTVKWALVVSVFCYSTYIASQFYPEFYTLLPTAVVLGLGAAPMWSAKCTYITQVAHRYVASQRSSAHQPILT